MAAHAPAQADPAASTARTWVWWCQRVVRQASLVGKLVSQSHLSCVCHGPDQLRLQGAAAVVGVRVPTQTRAAAPQALTPPPPPPDTHLQLHIVARVALCDRPQPLTHETAQAALPVQGLDVREFFAQPQLAHSTRSRLKRLVSKTRLHKRDLFYVCGEGRIQTRDTTERGGAMHQPERTPHLVIAPE